MTDWIILRTAGRNTLTLAETLAEDGFEVWAPTVTRCVRKPRWNVKRDVRLPLLPSFIFARRDHLIDLLELAAMPLKPRRGAGCRDASHKDFSVFHWHDQIPVIADEDLEPLRAMEAKQASRKRAERAFPSGSSVRVDTGSFGGMVGTVQRSDRGQTLVCFMGKYVVKIATSLLREDQAYNAAKPSTGTAARAA